MLLLCWLNVSEEFVKRRRAEGGSLRNEEGERKMRSSNRCEHFTRLYNHTETSKQGFFRILFQTFVTISFL